MKQWALFAPVIGSSLFFILTVIAMFTFTGGTAFNHENPGYSFFNNFFSDLGMTTSYTGDTNILSSTLFLLATIFCGGLMLPYFATIPSLFKKNKLDFFLMLIGSLLGFVAAFGYIGIGFTPWDTTLELHLFFVYLAFPTTLPVVICYVITFLRNKSVPKILSVVYISMGVILSVYLYLLFFGPNSSTEIGRIIQVVGQKIIVYAEIITFWIQGFFTSKYYRRTEEITGPILI